MHVYFSHQLYILTFVLVYLQVKCLISLMYDATIYPEYFCFCFAAEVVDCNDEKMPVV